MPPLETPGHSQESLAQSLVGSLLLSPEPCAYKVCFVLQESVFLGGLSPLPDLQLGKSFVGPRTFATVQELLWYNCSPVCESFARWLYGGPNGDILQEDLGHAQHLPGLLQPEPLSTWWPLLIRNSWADTQTLQGRSDSVFCWVSWSWCTQGFVWAFLPGISGWYGACNKHSFVPPTILLALLLCLWMWGIFLVRSNILLSMVVQQLVSILEFYGDKAIKYSPCPIMNYSGRSTVIYFPTLGFWICNRSKHSWYLSELSYWFFCFGI